MMETDSGTQLQVSATQEVSVSKNTGDKKSEQYGNGTVIFAGKSRKTRM